MIYIHINPAWPVITQNLTIFSFNYLNMKFYLKSFIFYLSNLIKSYTFLYLKYNLNSRVGLTSTIITYFRLKECINWICHIKSESDFYYVYMKHIFFNTNWNLCVRVANTLWLFCSQRWVSNVGINDFWYTNTHYNVSYYNNCFGETKFSLFALIFTKYIFLTQIWLGECIWFSTYLSFKVKIFCR